MRAPPISIAEGWRHAKPLLHVPFGAIASRLPPPRLQQTGPFTIDKGRAGRFIEHAIGLSAGSWKLDFSDGDLKTYASDSTGDPKETMAVHQIDERTIDDLIARVPFERSLTHRKTRQMIVLGVCKDGPPASWFIASARFVYAGPLSEWFRRLSRSYDQVIAALSLRVERGELLHRASTGKYLQVRPKDSKPYKPLVSQHLGRRVTDKRIGVYLTKDFMRDILREG